MTKELKTINYDFSCRQKDSVSSALRSVFGNLLQRVGAVLRDDLALESFLFMLSPNPEMVIVSFPTCLVFCKLQLRFNLLYSYDFINIRYFYQSVIIFCQM